MSEKIIQFDVESKRPTSYTTPMFGIGFSELVVIVLALFIIVGPKKTTEIVYSLGKWVNEFKLRVSKIRTGLDVDLNKPLDQISKTNDEN